MRADFSALEVDSFFDLDYRDGVSRSVWSDEALDLRTLNLSWINIKPSSYATFFAAPSSSEAVRFASSTILSFSVFFVLLGWLLMHSLDPFISGSTSWS